MDASYHTMQHYLDILEGAFLVRVLRPWHENLKKRQVKSPKVFIRDSGLLHFLHGIDDMRALREHPRYGASWEGFALEQTLALTGERDSWFWSTTAGAEIDLVLQRKGRRYGFEFKCSDAPSMTRSLHTALADLGLYRAWVIYPGSARYPLHEKVAALPLAALAEAVLAERLSD